MGSTELRRCWALSLSLGLGGCVGTTGSEVVSFAAFAAGPEDAEAGEALVFTNGRGFSVTLERASLHIGAVYLNQNRPISGAGSTACSLPGTYVVEVTRGLTLDALSAAAQAFPERGAGTATRAQSGEVWLFGTAYDAEDDPTPIVEVAGSATRDGQSYAFTGRLSIGKNRQTPPRDPAQPGSNPLCKQRIISPVPVSLTPANGGALLLRVDPRRWFANTDFAALTPTSDGHYAFTDTAQDAGSEILLSGVRSALGTYDFIWLASMP